MKRLCSRRTRLAGVLLACVAMSGSLVACGDSDEGSDAASTQGSSGNDAGEDAVVSQAKEIVQKATTGLLYFPGPETELDPAKVVSLGKTDWKGPTSAPKPTAGKRVNVISCAAGTGCEVVANAAAKAMKSMGWTAKVVNAQGTPDSYNSAFASAIAEKPDGILTVALPQSQVSDKIAEARSAGIKTVAAAAVPEKGADQYDAYQSLMETLSAQMEAYWAIADSDGKAKIAMVWDYGFPHLAQAAGEVKRVIESCSGCELLQEVKRTVVDAADPVAMGKLITSLVQRHGDDLEYVITPYGTGVEAMAQAAAAAGRTDIKFLSKNAEVQNIAAVAKGTQALDVAASLDWAGYAAADQLNRLIAGQKPLEPYQEGIGARIFQKENAPANGKVDWNQYTDFQSEYEKIWGVG